MSKVSLLNRAKPWGIGLLTQVRLTGLALRNRVLDRQAPTTTEVTLAERREALAHFYDHFETFVEAVCDAAQFGMKEAFVQRYATERRTLLRAYGEVGIHAAAYLRNLPNDAERHEEVLGRPGDTFQALLAPETLQTFIDSDDGLMISRITRAREALILYGDHLKQLGCSS